jgi:hypothetical protein
MKRIFIKNKKKFIIVDDNDFDKVSKYGWCINTGGYLIASRSINGTRPLLHRFITNAPKEMWVDHANHNLLDNRKSNLRVCTIRENMRNQKLRSDNTSGFKGLCWDKERNLWQVFIRGQKGEHKYMGRFKSRIAAARAYNIAAKSEYGKFALLNKICE